MERYQIVFSGVKNYDITKGRPKLALWFEVLKIHAKYNANVMVLFSGLSCHVKICDDGMILQYNQLRHATSHESLCGSQLPLVEFNMKI